MRVRLGRSDHWLCNSGECTPDHRIWFVHRQFEALQHLRRSCSDIFSLRSLRLALRNSGLNASQEHDDDLLRDVSHLLSSGRFHLCRWRRVPVAVTISDAEVQEPADTTAPPPASGPRERTRTAWIEIQLVDTDDKPVPGAAYEIKLPDGRVTTGTLDDFGRAWIDGIDPGTCEVTFPEIDGREWVRK